MAKKNLKGLSLDTREQDQIEGTYPFAKNGIQMDLKGAIINEPGFIRSSSNIPYTPMGIVDTDTRTVIFSTDDVNSAIGWYDEATDTYELIFTDADKNWKLGFKRENYITGQYQKNNKGQYIVAFTDKVISPGIINCNDPQITEKDDILLFMKSKPPVIKVTAENGGSVLVGSHYVSVKLVKADGSETPFVATSAPVVVTSNDGNEVSDKALRIELTNVDQRFQFVIVAIVSKIKGVTSAIQLDPVPASEVVSVVYTGNNLTQPITLDEILVKPTVYTRVGTIGQLNDELFLGDLEIGENIQYQRYANLIQVRVKSKLVELRNPPQELVSGAEKGFMHQEAYALYFQWDLTAGGSSAAFHISGPLPNSDDFSSFTQGGITAPKFQLQDTNRAPIFYDKSCSTGVWQNQDEVYPNHPQFDSTSIGGEDLRGKKVRHHRMPSLRYCKQNFYQGEPEYMKNRLDLLGLEISNVIVPPELVGKVSGYRILFARRTIGNSTVLGQSMMLHSAQDVRIYGQPNALISSGGNWSSQTERYDRGGRANLRIGLRPTRIRFHAFDMLFNKPTLPENTYMFAHAKIRINNVNTTTISYGVDENIARDKRTEKDAIATAYIIDYTSDNASTPAVTSQADQVRGVLKNSYATNNINGGEYNNTRLETAVVIETRNEMPAISEMEQFVAIGAVSDGKNTPMGNLRKDKYIQFEESYLCNLMVVRNNIYDSFSSQTLIPAGPTIAANTSSSPAIFAGDSFIGLYTFHTYGWNDAEDGAGAKDPERAGTKVIRRIAVESVSNINARYEIAGNIYSQFWPKTGVSIPGYNSYIMQYQRSIDPNQFGYSKDLNSLNDLNGGTPYNPYDESITKFPYRIHRGGKFKREGINRSWRTFLPLDYYEMPKNMGKIVNLEGMDDKLLIHHENALFVTQDKATFDSDTIDVTLGSGDIFQFIPQEALSSKLGYAGTQHDLACLKTPLGYMFIDAKQGQVFLYKGQLQLMNNGLNLFFRDYARIKENNPYIGNGMTLGYDSKYKRLMLTVKNKDINNNTSAVVPDYQATPEFIATLVPGTSIVYKDGRYQKFMGVNSNPAYACSAIPTPDIGNYNYSIPENSATLTPVGTVVGSGGTGALNYSIIGGNTNGAFSINVSTGQISVSNSGALNFEVTPSFALTVKVTDANGQSDTGIVNVSVTNVNEPPFVGDYQINISENTSIGTQILQVTGSDPEGLSISFVLIGSHPKFNLSSDGRLTTTEALSYSTQPSHVLTVQVSDGTLVGNGTITVNLNKVNKPPVGVDQSVYIFDTQAAGVIYSITPATDPDAEDPLEVVDYELVDESNPGVFTVDIDALSTDFLKVKLVDNASLNLSTSNNDYLITLRATDSFGASDDFTIRIYVLFDPALISFVPKDTQCGTGADADKKLTINAITRSSRYPNYDIETYANVNPGSFFQQDTTGEIQRQYFPPVNDGTCVPQTPCGSPSSYTGGESYPSSEQVNVGTDQGTVVLTFDAISVPDRFVVKKLDGTVLIDTGYRGEPGYQDQLNAALAAKGAGPSTIQGLGGGNATFNKNFTDSSVIVEVYAPMAGTAWSYILSCPGAAVGNDLQSRSIQRNNCDAGSTGSFYNYVVPENTFYRATKSQANAAAIDDIDTYGQNAANKVSDPQNAFCIPNTVISIGVIDIYNFPTANVYMIVNTPGVTPGATEFAYRDNRIIDPNNTPEEAFILASSQLDGSLSYRFEVNIGKLLGLYPSINEFYFELCGRAVSPGTIDGVYALKYPNQKMTMLESGGKFTPSVSPAGGPPTTNWSGPIVSGANNTFFAGMGAVIKRWTYNKTDNTFLPS